MARMKTEEIISNQEDLHVTMLLGVASRSTCPFHLYSGPHCAQKNTQYVVSHSEGSFFICTVGLPDFGEASVFSDTSDIEVPHERKHLFRFLLPLCEITKRSDTLFRGHTSLELYMYRIHVVNCYISLFTRMLTNTM